MASNSTPGSPLLWPREGRKRGTDLQLHMLPAPSDSGTPSPAILLHWEPGTLRASTASPGLLQRLQGDGERVGGQQHPRPRLLKRLRKDLASAGAFDLAPDEVPRKRVVLSHKPVSVLGK